MWSPIVEGLNDEVFNTNHVEGCKHCNEGIKIGDEFYIEISGNLLKGGYDDIEINYCPMCGRKLN